MLSAVMYQPTFAARSLPLRQQLARSEAVWLALITFLGVVHLYIVFVGGGLQDDPRSVLFDWPAIGIVGIVGLIGIVLADRTGFPAGWEATITNRRRIVLPLVIGAGLGLLDVGHD